MPVLDEDWQIGPAGRDALQGGFEALFGFIKSLAPEAGWQGTRVACWFLREEDKSEMLTRATELSSSRAYLPQQAAERIRLARWVLGKAEVE
jgi:hypothetical protein